MTRQAAARLQPPADFEDVLVRRARPLMGTLVGVTVRGHHRDGIEQADPRGLRRDGATGRHPVGMAARQRRLARESVRRRIAGPRSSRARRGHADGLRCVFRDRGSVRHCMGGAVRPVEIRRSRLSPASRRRRSGGTDVCRLSGYRPRRRSTNAFPCRRGMRLGLGGIAKAYIAERAADTAVASGVGHILIDAGGDVVARGDRASVRGPWASQSALGFTSAATLDLEDEVVATSGDYEHFVEVDGRRYHHLLGIQGPDIRPWRAEVRRSSRPMAHWPRRFRQPSSSSVRRG